LVRQNPFFEIIIKEYSTDDYIIVFLYAIVKTRVNRKL